MILKKWEDLPKELQLEGVRPYYDVLRKRKISLLVKRLFDILVSAIMLIVLSPVFLILSIAIKVDSKGPVFFRQERLTQYGRVFHIFKFRTMVNNADKIGTQVTVNNDVRITRIGSLIRNCRLDEIPQLINILIGDMSFVGTRPEVKKYVDCYTDEMRATLLMPAGVTSLASIKYKDEAELLLQADNADEVYVKHVLPDKMQYNLIAIKRFSLIYEFKLLFKTVIAIIK